MDEIQRYRIRADAEYMLKAEEGSWVGFTDHRIELAAQAKKHRDNTYVLGRSHDRTLREALEAQAEEHRKELKQEISRIALQQERFWSDKCMALHDQHAKDLSKARVEGYEAGESAMATDLCALREEEPALVKQVEKLTLALLSAQEVLRIDEELLLIDKGKREKRRRLYDTAMWHSTLAAAAHRAGATTEGEEPSDA